MRDNINDKHQQDLFSESIKSKLENHQVPVDPASWSEIEKHIQQKKRRKITFWWWIPLGSAAVIALLITLHPLSESPTYTSKVEQNAFQPKNEKHRAAKTQNKENTDNRFNHLNTVKQKLSRVENLPIAPIETAEDKLPTAFASDTVKPTRESIAQKSNKKNNDSTETVNPKSQYLPTNETFSPSNSKTKRINKWQIAATCSAADKLPTGNSGLMASNINPTISAVNANYTSILTENNFTDITYSPPVSFGLLVRKNLDKNFDIESGLVYTYLFTCFKKSGAQQNDAKLHLHYIGIPLNLVAPLWNNSKWELYISGGCMVEKGIESVYIQNQHSGNQTITTIVSEKINGFQWSLNSSVGITYKIQRKLGIYFEPKLSYYFDNNQPISTRTDQPVVIGLTAGVRYQFK